MNTEQDRPINLRQVFSVRAFHKLLKNPPDELYNSLGEEGFLEIANFLRRIHPEDQLNVSAMVKHIGLYCYQPGYEVLKKFYRQTYQSINPEDIKAIVKKTGDPGKKAYGLPTTGRDIENEGRDAREDLEKWTTEGRDACEDLQKWATEIKTNKDSNQK
ncbi:MAG: hypothetical protein ACRCU2_09795 [Planktothrix sp.]